MMRKLALLILVLLVLAGGALWWEWRRLAAPYRGFDGPEVFVEFEPGTSVSRMAERLAEAGVVSDVLTFRVAARLSGEERRLQAGEYRFTDPATPAEVVDRLVRGDVFVRPLTFPEGLTMREMAAIFERSGIGTASEFLAATRDVSLVADLDPGARSLEGFLFPDTYTLGRRAGASATVAAMVERFLAAFDHTLRAEAAAAGLTPREVVTLASIRKPPWAPSGPSWPRSIGIGCASACRSSATRPSSTR
jgi:UPF0755 protein